MKQTIFGAEQMINRVSAALKDFLKQEGAGGIVGFAYIAVRSGIAKLPPTALAGARSTGFHCLQLSASR